MRKRPNRRVKRPVRIVGDVAIIPLTRGFEATVDVADLPLVAGRNWSAMGPKDASGKIYARRVVRLEDGTNHQLLMHRVIVNAPPELDVDHRDGDTMNNRRNNLRVATISQNTQNSRRSSKNTSGFKGVSFSRAAGKWQAYINKEGRRFNLGLFATAEEAAAAYWEAAQKLHQEFARAA